ncbi:MAG: repeat protein, partial [Gemmataceae bacterium]|nr:repeat protein [Gemmataceae bacterium]
SPLTFAVDTTSVGTITGTTTETAVETVGTPEDDITVNAGVTVLSTGGDVVFTSGDSIVAQTGSLLKSGAGTVILTAGVGDLDNDASLTLNGTIVGNLSVTQTGNIYLDDLAPHLNRPGKTVTVTSLTGAILDSSNAADTGDDQDVVAANLALSAATGIGTSTIPIRTTVGNLVARTTTSGGIFLSNTGDLTVGFTGDPFQGVTVTGGTGGIELVNAGSVSVTTGTEVISGLGSVTVTATGAAANIVTGGGNAPAVASATGIVTLTAGQDLLLGDTAGTGSNGDVSGGGGVVLSAGRDITVDEGTAVSAAGTGTVAATAGTAGTGNISLLQTAAVTGARIFTAGGTITLTTGPGGTFTAAGGSGAGVATAGVGDITINADALSLADPVNAGSGIVTIAPVTVGRNIDLGTNPSPGNLGIAQADLDQITAGVLRIGDTTNTGTLTITAAIFGNPGLNTLALRAGGAISETGTGAVNVTNLAVQTLGGANLGTNASAVSNVAASVSLGRFALGNNGSLTVGTVDGVVGINSSGPLFLFNTASANDNDVLTVIQAITGGSDIILEFNHMTLAAAVSAPDHGIFLTPTIVGQLIDLGGPDAPGTLGLDATDLGQVTASLLSIDGLFRISQDIIITAPLAPPGVTTLSLRTAGGITETPGASITVPNLVIHAVNAVTMDNANDVTTGDLEAQVVGAGQGFRFTDKNDLAIGAAGSSMGISTNGGAIAVTATAGTLTVNTSVSAPAGTATLSAGTDLLIAPGASVSASGAVTLNIGTANTGSDSTIAGTVSGTTPSVVGGNGADRLTVDFTAGADLPNGLSFTAGSATTNELDVTDANGAAAHTYAVGGTGVARDGTTIGTTNVQTTTVTGGNLADTFTVTPSTTTVVAVDGGAPSSSPGDTLTLSGGTSPFLTITGSSPGNVDLAGDYTFGGGQQLVAFFGIETLSPAVTLNLTNTDNGVTTPGMQVQYTVTVANPAGGVGLSGVGIGEPFPTTLSGVTWTSVSSGGASGNTATGFGSITDANLTIPVGGSVVYTITGTIDPTATGTLVTTATITPPTGVANSASNTATDTITLTPTVGVSVTNSDGMTSVTPGTTTTYTVTVTNSGPSTAVGVTFTDMFPAGQVTSDTWTSTVSAGAASGNTAAGSGDIADTLTLQPGATVTYTVTALIDPAVTGTVTTTATATVPAGETNTGLPTTATDVDTLTPSADVGVAIAAPATGVVGTQLSYTITVTNAGPSTATGVQVTHPLPAGATVVSVTSGQGTVVTASGVVTASIGTLAPGVSATVTVVINPTAQGTLNLSATGTAGTADPSPSDNSTTATIAISQFPAFIVTGPGTGGGSQVLVLDAKTGTVLRTLTPFGPTWTSSITVAQGDLNGDGVPEVIVGAGAGGGPRVEAFDVRTGALVANFFAFDPSFAGGVNVAAGDVAGKGYADIVVGAGAGGGPNVKVFDGKTGAVLQSFFAYAPTFAGGVTVAAGDVNGDGEADIVTGVGIGGGPNVKVFDGKTGAVLQSFFAYAPSFTGGVRIAAGDVNGDGFADVITVPGAGGSANVKAFDGQTGSLLDSFIAFGAADRSGASVSAGHVSSAAADDFVVGTGTGLPGQVAVFNGRTAQEEAAYDPFGTGFLGGVYVG